MCDSYSSILIALEMTEAKSAMDQKQHASEMSHGAAITLRLCEICGITGTRRVVHGDSFFSSIDTALHLSAHGVYFSGIVKTAHAGYPKSFFKDWCVTVTFKLLGFPTPQSANLTFPHSYRFAHGFETAVTEELHKQEVKLSILAVKANREMQRTDKKKEIASINAALKLRLKRLNPKKKPARSANLPRGSHLALITKFRDKVLLSCAWADKTLKTSIGTCGHILPGTPIQRTTYKAVHAATGYPQQSIRNR
jgi:hypothetical protein